MRDGCHVFSAPRVTNHGGRSVIKTDCALFRSWSANRLQTSLDTPSHLTKARRDDEARQIVVIYRRKIERPETLRNPHIAAPKPHHVECPDTLKQLTRRHLARLHRPCF